MLLERRSSNKSNNSRRSSNLSRHESLPTVQVIPPSITGGKIKDEKLQKRLLLKMKFFDKNTMKVTMRYVFLDTPPIPTLDGSSSLLSECLITATPGKQQKTSNLGGGLR